MKLVDNFLDNITMYRLVLYVLIGLLAYAVILSFLHVLSFNPLSLLLSVSFLVSAAWITNKFFAFVFEIPANAESILISALILSLIITPVNTLHGTVILFWAAVWIAASKFILAINKKHIFNPAALAVFMTSFFGIGSASWWVGTAGMLPVVLIGGFLIVRKIERVDLFFAFLGTALITIFGLSFFRGTDMLVLVKKVFVDSPILFFGFVMLTEPLTAPPTKALRFFYGVLVGFLFSPQLHFGSIYTTPESALLLGNVFSYIVSPKVKLSLKLLQKIPLAPDIYDFVFALDRNFKFTPGQYMEWTLDVKKGDDRGNRRYFTLASSPTEKNLQIGVRFSQNSSAFKKELFNMDQNKRILAGSLAGDFTLPKDVKQKLVFIAGGIGITPFRSMVKYLSDTGEKRDIVIFYSIKEQGSAVYMDVLKEAEVKLGIRTIVVVSNIQGKITKEMIMQKVPDFAERMFYLSGPHNMVAAFQDTLGLLGLPGTHIKRDFFPGYV